MTPHSILVVDDNPMNLKLVRVLLGAAGYELRSAAAAEEVLQLLQDFRPSLILMDIQLPGMDGLSLTRQLKADPRFRDIPVVALSAYAMKGDSDKAIASGCAGHISKPIDTRTFTRLVAQYLAAARPAATASEEAA